MPDVHAGTPCTKRYERTHRSVRCRSGSWLRRRPAGWGLCAYRHQAATRVGTRVFDLAPPADLRRCGDRGHDRAGGRRDAVALGESSAVNPDNWEKTSTQLLQNSDVRAATANYVVDQLYANVDVAALIKSGLPPRLAPLAGPAAGALRNAAVQGVELALTRPEVQSQWAAANRAADQTFIATVNGGNGAVKV